MCFPLSPKRVSNIPSPRRAAFEPLSPVVGRSSVWPAVSVNFSVSLRVSFEVETKKTLPVGVVTTLDTTGLVFSNTLEATVGSTGFNGLTVGSSAFSFLFKAAKSALEIGRPWKESQESKTRVVPFERVSFTIPDKGASPMIPLRSSSTIRP